MKMLKKINKLPLVQRQNIAHEFRNNAIKKVNLDHLSEFEVETVFNRIDYITEMIYYGKLKKMYLGTF